MADKVKCVIISGAPENDCSYYNEYINDAYIICADSGYTKCEQLSIKPDLIIGDFDSSVLPNTDTEIIKLNVHKDDTDTFHCVEVALQRGYKDITILGGIGSRVDHTYSNILTLVYCFERGIKCALINKNNFITVRQGAFTLTRGKYSFFSMFAVFEKCEGLSIKGAEYELDNVELLPVSQLNQSNAFRDDTVNIEIKRGKILLILSND